MAHLDSAGALAGAGLECDRKATCGVMPKRFTSARPAAQYMQFLGRGIFVDIGVGDEQRLLLEHERVERGELLAGLRAR